MRSIDVSTPVMSGVARYVDGGVTRPRGFKAAGVACGIKRQRPGADAPLDLAFLVADEPIHAAKRQNRRAKRK